MNKDSSEHCEDTKQLQDHSIGHLIYIMIIQLSHSLLQTNQRPRIKRKIIHASHKEQGNAQSLLLLFGPIDNLLTLLNTKYN